MSLLIGFVIALQLVMFLVLGVIFYKLEQLEESKEERRRAEEFVSETLHQYWGAMQYILNCKACQKQIRSDIEAEKKPKKRKTRA